MSPGLAQSVQTRLVEHAKKIGVDPNLVLARYATERFLYRLSRSRHADRFVLKGALLLLVWLGETIRPTRDADLLGYGDVSDDALAATFAEICGAEVEPDGMTFEASSIRIDAIRPEDDYGGQRVTLLGRLGPARLRVQVDVGIGDAVSPDPEWLDYPSLLDLPRPRLRAYRPETAIAEKVHAMVVLGRANTRLRDFLDVWGLAHGFAFDGTILAGAIGATFERRRTELPDTLPECLTSAFLSNPERVLLWAVLMRRLGYVPAPELTAVGDGLSEFLLPVVEGLRTSGGYHGAWQPGGPWISKEPG